MGEKLLGCFRRVVGCLGRFHLSVKEQSGSDVSCHDDSQSNHVRADSELNTSTQNLVGSECLARLAGLVERVKVVKLE